MPSTIFTDVDNIARDLINAFDLTFEEQEQQLSDPIMRWLDYRLRYVDPQPRQVQKSVDFDARVPVQAISALDAFIHLSEVGGDLNPYLTKTIKRNDSSGTKRQLRTDGLWADWKIHHAHLTEEPLASGDEFSKRSEWLLFFFVLSDGLALIDVRPHNEPGIFQATDLVEKFIRSWPNLAEAFRVKGIVRLERSPATDPDTLKKLRVGGVMQFLEVDGIPYFPPGGGVTSAATSGDVSMTQIWVKNLAKNIESVFIAVDGEPMKAAVSKGVTTPVFSLQILQNGRLAVLCSEAAFSWPFSSATAPGDARLELEKLLLPPWAGAKLVSYLVAQQSVESANTP